MAKITRIYGRTAPRIQLCETCGRMRVHHARGLYSCDVPPEVTSALRSFKASNGARWKSKLRDLWESGQNNDELLQQARNIIGPTRLDKIKL